MRNVFVWTYIEIDKNDANTVLFYLPTLLLRIGDFPAGYNKLDHIKVNFEKNKMTMVDEDGQELASYDFDIVI